MSSVQKTTVKPNNNMKHPLKNTNSREFTLYARSNKVSKHQNNAPRILEEIFKFAKQSMGCNQVKIQSALFQHIWVTGIDSPPIHVRFSRKLVRDDNSKTYKTCAFVELVDSQKKKHPSSLPHQKSLE